MLPHLDRIIACTNCVNAEVKGGLPSCSKGAGPVYAEESTCPDGRWGSIFVANLIDQQDGTPAARQKARSYWESLKDLAGKAKQMAEVVTSGQADAETVALRKASCGSCLARKGADNKPIPFDVPVGDGQWCGDCGCGTKPWAKLDSKLEYAYLPCPRQRPGFSP